VHGTVVTDIDSVVPAELCVELEGVKQMLVKRLTAFLGVLAPACLLGGIAHAGSSVNTGYFGGVAIEGYDPVAYFTEGRPMKGSEEFALEWLGAMWQFANDRHRDLFAEQPVKYAPQYGGHCSGGVAFGENTINIDPEAWSIVGGKLYLQYSKSGVEEWKQNREELMARAEENWPEVKARVENAPGG